MNILKKGDYWIWEYCLEWFKLGKQGRAISKELRKLGANK